MRINGLSWSQASVVHDAKERKDGVFGLVGKTFAEVLDVDKAIQVVEIDLADHLAELRSSGRTAASPAHRSVLRKLEALRHDEAAKAPLIPAFQTTNPEMAWNR